MHDREIIERLVPALQYALQRLNAIPHPYTQTDFRFIENALAVAEGRPERWPGHKPNPDVAIALSHAARKGP